jgi:adenylyltransferase/sulfurtransferase
LVAGPAEKELSDYEFEYYSRQIALADIGYNGQLSLKNSRICILGCGGLGVPAMFMLTAMGVGYIRIVDRDVVSLSDLHRQYLYDPESVGRAKAEVAAERLRRLNPNVIIEPVAEPIGKGNISEIIKGMNAAVDALDSMETRYLVNRACHKENVPYVFAGAIDSIANASTIIPGKTPCLECLFP